MSKAKNLIIGFLLSALLTLLAFVLVNQHLGSLHRLYSHQVLTALILALALVQFGVHMMCFLNLGQESKKGNRWNLVIFLSTLSIICIIIIGSLWIMTHLNYNMSPQYMKESIMRNEGIYR